MKALTWHGLEDVRVESVPDPSIEQPTDAIVRVTSTAICGSDLHLYGVLAPYLTRGDVLGHEFMGVVEQVGSDVGELKVGDRVVVPFNISCGHCWMCSRGLFAQCETTQNTEQGKGASLFGYTSLYGAVPGGQAEYVRVPHADFGPIRLPEDLPDERFLYLSDILPTAWQGVQYADVGPDDTLAVIGLGPVGQLAVRSALHRGVGRVIGVDLVPERLARAAASGSEVVNAAAARLPKPVAQAAFESVGIDRLAALNLSLESVRRGGTVSISGVYGGMADPLPMMTMFDKGLTLRMGQCHVKRWTDELLEIALRPGDELGLETLATHRLPLSEAPEAYRMFQQKTDGCLKVVLHP